MSIPFDASLRPAQQVEVVEEPHEIQVIAYTTSWWSAGLRIGLQLLGAGLCLGAFVWLIIWGHDKGGTIYFSLGLFLVALAIGGTAFMKSVALSQHRLTITLEEDFFKVEQSTFIFQESQKYLYEEVVAIHAVPAFKIITTKEQHNRIWGRKLLPQQWKYLAQCLEPIWREPGKRTGEEEDWSEHLVD